MSRFAPPWALTAAALDGRGDPHLRPGVHLRVLPGPTLGLPVAPLLVDRISLGSGERIEPATDVLWTDARGDSLPVPFDLAPASPATAWLPSDPGNPVIYAEVLVKPVSITHGQRFGRVPFGETGPMGRGLGAARLPFPFPFPEPPRRPLPKSGVRVDAIVSGIHGPSVVATATRAPYQVCATGMDRVQVTGAGTVVGIRVLRAFQVHERPGREPWHYLALPIERGGRYEGFADAWGRAEDRVLRGAPQLLGLHDDPDAADPSSCDPVAPSDDMERVKLLWALRLEPMVRAIVDDLSGPPARLLMAPQPLSGTSVATATLEVPPLTGVLQGAFDPGVGRLLGLVEHDDSPPGSSGDIVVYVVRGAWTAHAKSAGWLGPLLLLGGPDDPGDFPLPLPSLVKDQREGTFVDLWTMAAAVVGLVSPTLPGPVVGAPQDLGWVPEVPPTARRHVVLPLSGLAPAAAIALARESPGVVGLNPRLRDVFGAGAPDRATPIVPGVLAENGAASAASAPGQGEVHDRFTLEGATDYRVAQSDWFGRWSPWARASVGDGVRPPVPVPVIEAAYVDPATLGGSGTMQVRCLQPRDPDLPPGGFPLDALAVTATVGGGGPVAGSAAAIRGAAPAGVDAAPLIVSLNVPPLAPAELRDLVATARWKDAGGRLSAESPPAHAQAVDPRAPAPLTIANTLEYAARPDALGRSRVRVQWNATANTAYRVYFSGRDDPAAAPVRSRGGGHPWCRERPHRVDLGLLGTRPGRGVPHQRRALRPDVLRAVDTHAAARHVVGADVVRPRGVRLAPRDRVLQGAAGVGAGDFAAAAARRGDILRRVGARAARCAEQPCATCADPHGCPPRDRSAQGAADGGGAGGPDRAGRDAAAPQPVSGADALAMPVVSSSTPAAWPAVVDDDGATPWDSSLRFAPWSTYTWRAEVQGGPEPGSSVPGLWSGSSTPVSWKVVPAPPVAVTPGTAVLGATGVQVRFSSTNSLDAGGEGAYVLDVYRVTPAASTEPSGAVGSYPAGARRQPDGTYLIEDTAPSVPAGTSYLVEVCDPLGRRSPRVSVATLL